MAVMAQSGRKFTSKDPRLRDSRDSPKCMQQFPRPHVAIHGNFMQSLLDPGLSGVAGHISIPEDLVGYP